MVGVITWLIGLKDMFSGVVLEGAMAKTFNGMLLSGFGLLTSVTAFGLAGVILAVRRGPTRPDTRDRLFS
jgi:hypothetical protein